jgi:adenine phosphoribosyltransferase
MELSEKIKSKIRDVKDYPKPGIIFKDITPVLANPLLVREITGGLVEQLKLLKFDAIAAIEARGFIFGSILAHELNCRFIPVRKAGKLPFTTVRQEYALEYGSGSVEMHTDAIEPGWKVLVHDDLLATGGTAVAAGQMIRRLKADVVGFSFLINLGFLPGEQYLQKEFGIKPRYLVTY